jgi:hypothetical protein
VEALLDWRTAGPRGPVESGRRILVIPARELNPRLTGAWAVIEGPENAVDGLNEMLVAGLRRDAGPPGDGNADPAQFACTLLQDALQRVPDDRQRVSVAFAVQAGGRLHLACAGEARAFISDDVAVTEPVQYVRTGEIRQASIPVRSNSTLVLLATSLPTNLSFSEIRQAIRGSADSETSAEWLATLAAARSGDCASTMVLHYDAPGRSTVLQRAGRSAIWIGGSIALVLGILAVVFLVRSLLAGQSHAARPVLTGLRAASVGPTHADLAWNRLPRARTYVVSIAGQTYRSAAPHVRVTQGLRPGGSYSWQVRAQLSAAPPVLSHIATLHLPGLYSPPAIQAVRPHGVRSVYSAPHVEFCWRTDASAQSFDLYVVGPTLHFHHTYQRSQLHVGRRGALCATMAVDPKASYSWRAGASAPEHREGWTPWTYFRFGQTARRTSTVAVQTAARTVAAAIHRRTSFRATVSAQRLEPTVVRVFTQPLPTPTPLPVAPPASITGSPGYAKLPSRVQPAGASVRRDLHKAASQATAHAWTDRSRASRPQTRLPLPPPPPPSPPLPSATTSS